MWKENHIDIAVNTTLGLNIIESPFNYPNLPIIPQIKTPANERGYK
tara:strand:+ start:49 stop:186 length:138 start_codon:yes stop_codon:yes gene_type:complete